MIHCLVSGDKLTAKFNIIIIDSLINISATRNISNFHRDVKIRDDSPLSKMTHL